MSPRPRLVRPWPPTTPWVMLDRRRLFSVSSPAARETGSLTPAASSSPSSGRWLGELQSRIGKCISFGCSRDQASRAAIVLRALAEEWRRLTAGKDGFLTGGRRGLEDHKVVWGVMDSFQHVNNVTYLRYAESSRVNWVTNFAVHVDPVHSQQWKELMTPRATGLILKSISVDFKLPIVYPDTVSVYHRLQRAPPPLEPSPPSGHEGAADASSFGLECVVLSHKHRRPAALIKEAVVTYDYQAGRKAVLPSFVRDVFVETYSLQLEEQARAQARIRELYGLVEILERETWDRADAVEDMGAAAAP